MLNTSSNSSRIKSSFENDAAAHFRNGSILAISLQLFVGLMHTIHRWKGIDQVLHPYVEHFL